VSAGLDAPTYAMRPVSRIARLVPAELTIPVPRFIRSIADRIDRVLARLPEPVEARVRDRLGLDLFVVVAAVVVVLRLFAVFPWTPWVLDMHTYWATGAGITYDNSNPYVIGAYLYAPAFAQALYPLFSLPWPWFAALWTAAIAATYIWLVGRWAFPLLFTGAVALELYLGQIDIFIAAAVVLGFRFPAVWAFPLLTKVAPGIGLLWFVVRREWRNLAIAVAATVAIAGVSAWISPALWNDWYDLLRRSITDRQVVEGAYIGIPVWLRLPFAVAIIVWGARTDRHWTVPIGILLAMPILWVNVFTLLLAVVPLREEPGLTPARAWLLRERLLPAGLRRKRSVVTSAG
jgi:Glycosyltransferase family 87